MWDSLTALELKGSQKLPAYERSGVDYCATTCIALRRRETVAEGSKMGWERRGKDGKRLVYYRKKRVGKRVFSVYVGPGESGERAEREDRERREDARMVVSAPSDTPEVLQGATGGATPEVTKLASVTASDDEQRWAKFFTRPPQPRRYRR